MTDKEKRTLKDGVKNLIGKYKSLEHGIIEVLENNILSFIDSMQEEPVSELLNTDSMVESYKQRLISQANGVKNSPLVDMCLASYKHGINETLDTLKLSNVQRTVKDWKEEPVSEDLEEASKKYSSCIYLEEVLSDDDKEVLKERLINTFKAGAEWKKQQFEKNRLAACDAQTEKEAEIERDFVMSIIEKEHRQPTFDDAIKYGMRLQRENMIEKACKWLQCHYRVIDGEVEDFICSLKQAMKDE